MKEEEAKGPIELTTMKVENDEDLDKEVNKNNWFLVVLTDGLWLWWRGLFVNQSIKWGTISKCVKLLFVLLLWEIFLLNN